MKKEKPKTKPVMVRLDIETIDRLKKQADKNYRSLSSEIRAQLEKPVLAGKGE